MPGIWSFILGWAVLAWGSSANTGRPIRIGVAPMDMSPWYDFSSGTKNDKQLFVPAFVRALSERSSLQFTYVVQGNYSVARLHQLAYRGLVDDAFDIYLDALSAGFDPDNIHKLYPSIPKSVATFTVPMYTQHYWVVILKERAPISFLRFLDPFHWKLWLAIVVALFLFSGALVLVHVISPYAGASGTCSTWFAATAVYHTWAAFLGGEDFEWLTTPGKILRIALLFLVLISGATYTANLAAFFTKPSFRLVGPQNLEELRTSTVCIMYPQASYVAMPYVKDVIVVPEYMMTHTIDQQYNWCIEQIRAGKADALFDQGTSAQEFLLQNCDRVARAEDLNLAPSNFIWLSLRSRAEMLEALNEAMLSFTGSPAYQELLTTVFSTGRSCQDELIDSDTQKITLEHMEGFLIIFGILVAAAVAAAIAQKALFAIMGHQKKDEEGHGAEGQTDGEMLVQLSAKVDKVIEAISLRGQSASPLSCEKDIEQNLNLQLTQQTVRTLEAENRALEAEKRAEALQHQLSIRGQSGEKSIEQDVAVQLTHLQLRTLEAANRAMEAEKRAEALQHQLSIRGQSGEQGLSELSFERSLRAWDDDFDNFFNQSEAVR